MISFSGLLISMVLFCSTDSLVQEWGSRLEQGGLHHVVARQVLYWPLTGDRLERKMELWFAPPNRLRVQYSPPDSQIIVTDGENVSNLVPENNQVLVQRQDPSATWRDTPLGRIFALDAYPCSIDTIVHEELPGISITCVDTTGATQFVRINLLLSEDHEWPSLAKLEDISGNITTYHILLWEERSLSIPDDSLFCLSIPKGMELVKID